MSPLFIRTVEMGARSRGECIPTPCSVLYPTDESAVAFVTHRGVGRAHLVNDELLAFSFLPCPDHEALVKEAYGVDWSEVKHLLTASDEELAGWRHAFGEKLTNTTSECKQVVDAAFEVADQSPFDHGYAAIEASGYSLRTARAIIALLSKDLNVFNTALAPLRDFDKIRLIENISAVVEIQPPEQVWNWVYEKLSAPLSGSSTIQEYRRVVLMVIEKGKENEPKLSGGFERPLSMINAFYCEGNSLDDNVLPCRMTLGHHAPNVFIEDLLLNSGVFITPIEENYIKHGYLGAIGDGGSIVVVERTSDHINHEDIPVTFILVSQHE